MHLASFGALDKIEHESCDMTWTLPEFSNTEVDNAGASLASNTVSTADSEIIDNWRSAHNFPLNTFQTVLRNRAQAIDSSCVIAQRIKRLSSITDKLKRYRTTRLSQMQDIGGCRAVMYNVAMVNRMVEAFKTSGANHILHSEKDYVKNHKPDG